MNKIKCLENEFDAKITYIDTNAMNLSSTEIRDFDFDENDNHTDEKVLKYIKDNKLYI